MKATVLCLGLCLALTACEKDSSDESNNGINELIGRYTGTFARTGMDSTIVNFYFKEDGSFEGSSETPYYPAICSGTFERDGNILTINDTCTWTANFDWTLIFDGTYSISLGENQTARIWRTNGAITDEYLLRRFSR